MGYREGVETGIARAAAESKGTAGIANSTEAQATSRFTQRAVALDMGTGATIVRITSGGNLRAEAHAHLYAAAKALGSRSLFTGDSWARATGLSAGITNHGIVSVRARPESTAFATAGQLQGIEPVNAAATASSDANGTRAWGIRADANLYALTDSDPDGAGPRANATAKATAEAINTRAFGIESGASKDTIENRGTIFVQALPRAVAATRATAGPGDSKNSLPEFRADNNITLLGRVAIDSGPGNDQVFLLGGETRGDMLRLFGGSTQTLNVAEFENPEKFSTGTWRLTRFPGSQTMRVVAGTVEFAGTVSMSGTHAMTSRIWPSGEVGRIHFDSAGLQLLSGRLSVATVPGVHVNGRTWDVLTARGGLDNLLNGIDLPPATGLVSFATAFEAPGPLGVHTRYRVRGSVLPMAGVARGLGAPAQSFAAALDGATPVAEGAIARPIAALQQPGTAGEVRAAVEALAPQLPQLVLSSASGAIASNLALLKARPGSPAFVSPAGLPFVAQQHGAAPAAGGSSWGQVHALTGVAADLDLPLADGLDAGLVIGGGHSRFTGAQSRPAIGEGMPGRLRQDSGLAMVSVTLCWQPFPARPGVLLEGRLDWQRVDGDAAQDATDSGLALEIARARLDRLDSELATRWQEARRLGPVPIATDLKFGWQRSLRPGAALVGAAFADMPDHGFRLLGPAPTRDRLGLDLVGRLGRDRGWSLEMAGLVRTGQPDAGGGRGTELGARLSLGVRF